MLLIIVSLFKIGSLATSATETPVPPFYYTVDLINNARNDVFASMQDYEGYDYNGTSVDWTTALKEPGKDNEHWVNYYVMNSNVTKGSFHEANYPLNLIITSPNNEAILNAIRGGANKEYRSILELMYEYKTHNTMQTEELESFEEFKRDLVEHVYKEGTDRDNYDKIQDAMSKTTFTDEEWRLAASGAHVDRLKIMLKQFKKSNLSKKDMNDVLYRQDLYMKTWNVSIMKMLTEEQVPFIRTGFTQIRKACYSQVNQKLRADNLNEFYLHDFGDDLAHINEVLPDFEGISILMAIKDDNLNRNMSVFFMNPNIGYYKSEWIIYAIKYANMNVLTVLLEERVPLPTAQDLAAAIAIRKEKTKTAQEFNNLIDSYRRFYNPTTRLCIKGPKFCRKRIEESRGGDNGKPIKIILSNKISYFKAYNLSGNLTYPASKYTECHPFGTYEEGEPI